jgi:phosphoglycerate dehydrogenase-like enzyme
MIDGSLTIWCNNEFTAEQSAERNLFVNGVRPHRLLLFDPRDTKAHNTLQGAEIAFGAPDVQAIIESLKVRWVHLKSAGYTSFDRRHVRETLSRRGMIVTNSSDVYAEPCAQHLLAMITGLARGLPIALDAQRGDRSWRRSIRPSLPLLNNQTLLILGFGAIARRLIELLRPLQMNLIAVRRRINGDEPIRVITLAELDDLLPTIDHLVNTLPENAETENFLNATRLAMIKTGAFVYNIGRGTTLDQDALIRELRSGHLGAAYLDVTKPEPLPPEHPLWSAPNCLITPHLAGGHRTEKERQVKAFLDNLRRFEQGMPLRNRVI